MEYPIIIILLALLQCLFFAIPTGLRLSLKPDNVNINVGVVC